MSDPPTADESCSSPGHLILNIPPPPRRKKLSIKRFCLYLSFFVVFLCVGGFACLVLSVIRLAFKEFWETVASPHRVSLAGNTTDAGVVRPFFGSEQRGDLVGSVFVRLGKEFISGQLENEPLSSDERLVYGEWECVFSEVLFKGVGPDTKVLHQTVDVEIPQPFL